MNSWPDLRESWWKGVAWVKKEPIRIFEQNRVMAQTFALFLTSGNGLGGGCLFPNAFVVYVTKA